jgi:hypothetical protein
MTAETYFWVLVGKFGGQALLQWILPIVRMAPATSDSGMMQAVVFHGPYKVAVEQRPIPMCNSLNNIAISTGLCVK